MTLIELSIYPDITSAVLSILGEQELYTTLTLVDVSYVSLYTVSCVENGTETQYKAFIKIGS